MNASDLVRLHVVTRVRRCAVDGRRINGLDGSGLLVTRNTVPDVLCGSVSRKRVAIAQACVTLTVPYSC